MASSIVNDHQWHQFRTPGVCMFLSCTLVGWFSNADGSYWVQGRNSCLSFIYLAGFAIVQFLAFRGALLKNVSAVQTRVQAIFADAIICCDMTPCQSFPCCFTARSFPRYSSWSALTHIFFLGVSWKEENKAANTRSQSNEMAWYWFEDFVSHDVDAKLWLPDAKPSDKTCHSLHWWSIQLFLPWTQ